MVKMREILFRGKRVDSGEWAYGVGPLEVCPGKWATMYTPKEFCYVKPETVGQYTGLRDKNGVKIFEGDIVWEEYDKPDIDGATHTTPEVVEYEAGRARFIMRLGKCVPDEMDGYTSRTVEVIGNMWDGVVGK